MDFSTANQIWSHFARDCHDRSLVHHLSEGQKLLMFRRVVVSTALVSVLVAASFGTAHAATVPPGKWAPKFCTAIDDYQTTISAQSDDLTTTLASVTDLQTGRDQIVAFLGNMVAAANTAAGALKQAGAPSTPNGAKIAAKFVAGLKASATVFADGKANAAKLSTTSVAAFQKQGKQVGVDLTDASEQLSKSFDGIGKLDKGKQLEKAVKAAPECAFLI